MTEADARDPEELPAEIREEVPTWDDEYFDRVGDRLMFSYDLERNHRVRGESFDLYGEFRVRTQKQFFHPALSYADHDRAEYLFARRTARPAVADLESLVELGHDLADDWIVPSEEHFGTEFTFVVVADELTDPVREFVEGFRERELLAYGYYGHYEINLVVVAPDTETVIASTEADTAEAFALWGDVDRPSESFLSRFAKRFWT
ncbi:MULTISPECIES: hypothetical protein [Halolamina]|uniref:DUF8052 domain-containing protein n=1 Tax=Halolamina pelagica TaxID=699431 RepID=A0A1I5N1I5_9EURY|nr:MULTISPECIES: hypothetical protein [Halolamina]NHX36264.1 hypothetical protein [Halolamina sp. R1-12]SFP15688.1 hypothetical protein SAMN05216277_101512 [Halolamina pelagica]